MTDHDALLAAILAAPEDDAPRLVYADWLDENGRDGEARVFRKAAGRAFATDRDRVRFAFAALRRQGCFARMDFWCCSSCAWAAVPDGEDWVVLYHKQDAEAFDEDGNLTGRSLYLRYRGDARPVLSALLATGLRYEWSGDEYVGIEVTPG